MKKEIKKCRICNEGINLGKDNYCHLIDYFKGKFLEEGYYHTKCWNAKLNQGKELGAMKKAMWGLIRKANKQMGGEEVEYQVQ